MIGQIHRYRFSYLAGLVVLFIFALFLLEKSMTLSAPTLGTDLSASTIVEPGDINVKIGEVNIQVPGTDVIIHDGDAYSVVDWHGPEQLTTIDPDLRFVTSAGSATYSDGQLIFDSGDSTLSADDTIVMSAPLQEFPVNPTNARNEYDMAGWLDQNNDGDYDPGEDFVQFEHSASALINGSPIRLFTDNEIYVSRGASPGDADISPFFTGSTYINPSFLSDNNSNYVLDAGDTVLTNGDGFVFGLSTDDNVCFDGSINNDAEFDYTNSSTYEVIWWDADGDCATFDTGVDIVLTGPSLPTGTSTEFGTEKEIGFFGQYPTDPNLGTYQCMRGETLGSGCFALAYTGLNGVNWGEQVGFTTNTKFFNSSSVAIDGLTNATLGWDEIGYAYSGPNYAYSRETFIDLYNNAGANGHIHSYVDNNSNTSFDIGEPVLLVKPFVNSGSSIPDSGMPATGQVVRIFEEEGYKYLDPAGESTYPGYYGYSNPLVLSSNAVFDVGAINGTGTDTLVYYEPEMDSRYSTLSNGHIVKSFAQDGRSLKYFDHDTSGSFQSGDDIIYDVDGSGFYHGDQLLTFSLDKTKESSPFSDHELDAVFVMLPVGESCAGQGTDLVLGSLLNPPFLNSDIPINAGWLFDYHDNGTVRNTLCIYADIASDAYSGLRTGFKTPANEIVFSSGAISSEAIINNASVLIQSTIDANVTTGQIGKQNTLVVTTTSTGHVLSDTRILAGFPSTLTTTGAIMSCQKNGSSIQGSNLQYTAEGGIKVIALTVTDGTVFAPNDIITCSISNFTGPSVAGVYTGGMFGVNTENGAPTPSTNAMIDSDIAYHFTNPGDSVIDIIEPPTYAVTVLAPNGGEVLRGGETYSINWKTQDEVVFVNIAYSIDCGKTYKDIIRGIPNTGSYAWRVPNVIASEALVRVQSTDLSTILNSDISDEKFSIVDPKKPYLSWRSPENNAVLQAGSKQWLLWDSSSLVTEIELAISIDGGATYPVTTGRVENKKAYQLQLTNEDIEKVYIKLMGYTDGFDDIEIIAGPFSISKQVDDAKITILTPNAMQAFTPGQKTTITWETEGSIPTVEIEFAEDGSTWVPISEFIQNTGSFEWTIPDVESRYGFVRVSGQSIYKQFVSDRSDEPFWIVRNILPAIDFVAPKVNTTFDVKDTARILWNTVGDIPYVNLYLTFADGAKTALALGMKNVHFYDLEIAKVSADTFGLLLEGLSSKGKVLTSTQTGPFSISPLSFVDPANPLREFIMTEDTRPLFEKGDGRRSDIPDVDIDIGEKNGRQGAEDQISGQDSSDRSGGSRGDRISFIPPGEDGEFSNGSSGDSSSMPPQEYVLNDGTGEFAFDQSGLSLYEQDIRSRVSVANKTIEFNPQKEIDAIIGTNVLVELITNSGNFSYSTNDGVSAPFENAEEGVRTAYVPIGSQTTHVKIKSQDLNPPYVLSLRVNPHTQGYVRGLEVQDGSETVIVLQGSTEWDSVATGQLNPKRLGTDGLFAWYVPNGKYSVELRNTDASLIKKDVKITNHILNPALIFNEVIVKEEVPLILDILIPDEAEQAIIKTVESVRVNESARTVADIAIPVAVATAVGGSILLGLFFGLLDYLRYLFTSPLLAFGSRRRRTFGMVYNSMTKAPISFAIIRFYDKDRRLARTVVTDAKGHYMVLLPPGSYRPVVIKPGYAFPSDIVVSDTDGELEGVYRGGMISVTEERPIVKTHFPLDPDQITHRIVSLRRIAIVRTLQYIIAFTGLFLSAYAVFMNPSSGTVILLIVQIIIAGLSFGLMKGHGMQHTGKVLGINGKPLAGTVVRLFEATYKKLIETQRTDAKGRFNFIAKQGQFYVVAETPQGKITSRTIDYRDETELKQVAPILRVS